MAWATTGGPATNSWAMSRTMTEKWPSTALAAPMPTTLPSRTLTTGTLASCSANMELPRCPGRKEPPPPVTRGRPAVMAPELSLAALSPLRLWVGHHGGDAAAAGGAVEQPHGRTAHGERQAVEIAALGPDRAVGVAAAGGEVVGADDGGAPLDLAPAADVVGRREVGDGAVLVVGGEAGQAAHLAEAAGIEQQVDALAAGQLAAVALADDAGILGAGGEAGVGDVLQGRDLGHHRGPAVLAVGAGLARVAVVGAGDDGGDDLAGCHRGADLGRAR